MLARSCALIAIAIILCAGSLRFQTSDATSTTLGITSGGTIVGTVAKGKLVTLTAKVESGSLAVPAGVVDFCDQAPPHCTDIHLVGNGKGPMPAKILMRFRSYRRPLVPIPSAFPGGAVGIQRTCGLHNFGKS